MTAYIIDIEANGLLLDATQVWCVVLKNLTTSEVTSYVGADLLQLSNHLSDASLLIGHNIQSYDLPVLRRLCNVEYDYSKVFDTMLISQMLFPDRDGGHSLNAWGERLGCRKTEFSDFTKFSPEMLEYCKQDVEVTHRLFNRLLADVKTVDNKIKTAVDIENKFAYLINKQIETGFYLDVPKAKALYQELSVEFEAIKAEVTQLMPKVKDETHYKSVVKSGNLISMSNKGYLYNSRNKIVEKEWKYNEPNPGSRQQLAEWLISKGWYPKERTETGQPKIDEKVLSTITIPEASKLARMFRIQKQLGMLHDGDAGWLKLVTDKSRVHGDVRTIGTNTSRCSHNRPNLAQVDKKDLRMRDVWIPQPGWSLVGCDASGLELRVLGHYLHSFDGGAFAHEVVSGDIHTFNQQAAGLLKRDSAKTMIYALIYGAGDKKLGTIVQADQSLGYCSEQKLKTIGSELRASFMINITGYETLLNKVVGSYKYRGYLLSIDGRPLYPRTDYSALNLLIQSAGAIIMKQALNRSYDLFNTAGLIIGTDYNYVANVHDEAQIECKPEIAEMIGKLFQQAIRDVTSILNLKVQLDGEYRIGKSWAETH